MSTPPLALKIHPIALLSIVDHHNRTVGNKTQKRAVGLLLGTSHNNIYDCINTYAVPFDETSKEGVWYLDHNYHEKMFAMFKKINIEEKVLGWYVTGSTFKKHDLEINELISNYCSEPILCVVDVKMRDSIELPTKAFYSEKTVNEKGFV